MIKLAIIGTAGREIPNVLTRDHWTKMCVDALARISHGSTVLQDHIHLVSGGAAWADHLAVWLFNMGYVTQLTLHFPCAWDRTYGWFEDTGDRDPRSNPGKTANYYHQKFSSICGISSLTEIQMAMRSEHCDTLVTAGFFDRNTMVATESDYMLAYGTVPGAHPPRDSGTYNTWNKWQGRHPHKTPRYVNILEL